MKSQTKCWEWEGPHTSDGYSRTSWKGKPLYVHRIVYEEMHGPIPEGLEIDHLCQNRGCVNPTHLEAVTHGENIRRGKNHGRLGKPLKVCQRGHDLTDPANRTTARSGRGCRTCHNMKSRERTRRRREEAQL